MPSPLDRIRYAIVDTEVSVNDRRVHDIGAWRCDGATMHCGSKRELMSFISEVDYLCGHNIVRHDARYLFTDNERGRWRYIDTLYMSPLMFPERPYHRLVKDDKLISDEANNPLSDCQKARELLYDEINAWFALPQQKRDILGSLLWGDECFDGFLGLVAASRLMPKLVPSAILAHYAGRICQNAPLADIVSQHPRELAYALSLIDTTDYRSTTPAWVLNTYPHVEHVLRLLRHTDCGDPACAYCRRQLDLHHNLNEIFGYDDFRTYNGEPLQQRAAQAAVNGESLLAIFPTGGGKSLTFQLPALMANKLMRGLTVVISPLQSLMKDQVDNLIDRGITSAVTINGLLDPLTRANAIERVMSGDASILYISPEMLRSKTVERILLNRHIVRFVIDEAHCFSAWGQDFRVDYLYIGKFLFEHQRQKGLAEPIPVSCFTATAKQKVIQDICDYFRNTLGLELRLFASSATRTNLQYSVLHVDNDEEKYQLLRKLVSDSDCPTIVYVSRTRRTVELASSLRRDGFAALPFNGKMPPEQKIANQESFMSGQVRIIVATSAFGMGVDKSDVGLVVHYDISDSLENYIQEAGRGGRDPRLNARCYVLYNDNDLDKHFILINQTKLSISEIQQVWRAVRDLTRQRPRVQCSALEIARQAGWDDTVSDIETRVRTALAILEQRGFLIRGSNTPHVYATGIMVKNVDEARQRLTASALFDEKDIEPAVRVIKSLISQKNISKAQNAEAESRVDYLADILGMTREHVVWIVERMRQDGILADSRDLSAYLHEGTDDERRALRLLDQHLQLDVFMLSHIPPEGINTSLKQLNEDAVNASVPNVTEKRIRTVLHFLTIKGYIKKHESARTVRVHPQGEASALKHRFERRAEICRAAVKYLYEVAATQPVTDPAEKRPVKFSLVEMTRMLAQRLAMVLDQLPTLSEIEEALLYMSQTGVIKLEGGFMVLYSSMDIQRVRDLRSRFLKEDYRILDQFYQLKIQQVHIVGEYANMMVRDYAAAQRFVSDYFHMDYRQFIAKYFKGERQEQIKRNITNDKYNRLFGALSDRQREIISDHDSRCIVVGAGPGSGKTRVLVHKLASLMQLEDVKYEQLLMLTFSRATAIEFKQRMLALIGNAAHYLEIKTFHSYSFDLLGRMGNINDSADIVPRAAQMIESGDVEANRISKAVLVIDEAQDIGPDEFRLVKALMDANDNMRVIAVGDDDQGIYEFRGSDSSYMYQLSRQPDSKLYELTENYRSTRLPVAFANAFVTGISRRIKTQPITSMSPDDGCISITTHTSKALYQPLVDQIIEQKPEGTTCVLTLTNEEAAIANALLLDRGVQSCLIQSMGGIRFSDLVEVRHLLGYINARGTSPVISDELWHDAIRDTLGHYHRSTVMPFVDRCVKLFEQTNRMKYISDLVSHMYESSIEDFCDADDAQVIVSTIHKSKGREYDNVYMLLGERFDDKTPDRLRRTIYVGVTRAKRQLHVHQCSEYFPGITVGERYYDDTEYAMPQRVTVQATHKDIILDYFYQVANLINDMQAGDPLEYHNGAFYNARNQVVATISNKLANELAVWQQRGYHVTSASVRFIALWNKKDPSRHFPETPILLPDITLSK